MPHFHIPLQSGSDEILGKMKRKYNTNIYKNKVLKIAKEIPEIQEIIDDLIESSSSLIKEWTEKEYM